MSGSHQDQSSAHPHSSRRRWFVALVFLGLGIPGGLIGGFFGWLCGAFAGDAAFAGRDMIPPNSPLYTMIGILVGVLPAIVWLIGSIWAKD